MKEIKLLGNTYKVAYDFATVLTYEETFNTDLDLTTVAKTGNNLRLLYAVLKAANKDTFVIPFDFFTHALLPHELKALNDTVAPIMFSFYNMAQIAEQHVPEQEPDEEDTAKNA